MTKHSELPGQEWFVGRDGKVWLGVQSRPAGHWELIRKLVSTTGSSWTVMRDHNNPDRWIAMGVDLEPQRRYVSESANGALNKALTTEIGLALGFIKP